MADDRHYVPGDFYRIDERTGFKVRAGRTRQEWTGRFVREESWEARQPQDFVKGVRDDQTVPDPRPRGSDQNVDLSLYAMFMVYTDNPAYKQIYNQDHQIMVFGSSQQVVVPNYAKTTFGQSDLGQGSDVLG